MNAPTVRVGGIDYLNALPLTRYLREGGEPNVRLTNSAPSLLASALRSGGLDVALAPVVEYLAKPEYRLVPGICISSYGAVESIRFYHRRPLGDLRTVGLDTSSRSSALMLRLFFRELWRAGPRFVSVPPELALARVGGVDETAAVSERIFARGEGERDSAPSLGEERRLLDDLDGLLLIGDAALRAPTTTSWEMLDLGTEWTRWTGLPFVYAFWIWRGGVAPIRLVERLHEARDVGLARIDDIVGGLDADMVARFGASACREYLRRSIQYDFGRPQQAALKHFFGLLERSGLSAHAPRDPEYVAGSAVASA